MNSRGRIVDKRVVIAVVSGHTGEKGSKKACVWGMWEGSQAGRREILGRVEEQSEMGGTKGEKGRAGGEDGQVSAISGEYGLEGNGGVAPCISLRFVEIAGQIWALFARGGVVDRLESVLE